MPTFHSSEKHPWRTHRFWRLFSRKKPPLIDVNYSYQYMLRFPRLPITVPPLVPTLMSYRCIDSLNACFQQQKNRTSYDFCLCTGGSSVLAKRNDEDDCDPSPKKFSRDSHQQYIRRRLPKRYSDVVGPSSTKIYLPRKDSAHRDKQKAIPPSQPNHQRASIKVPNKSSNRKSTEILPPPPRTDKKEQAPVARRYSSKQKRFPSNNAVDHLAQRMQAAMSTELMHSLDRNFVFGDKKQQAIANCIKINRSHSFHISTSPSNDWPEKSPQKQQQQQHFYHRIPKIKPVSDDDEQSSVETSPSFDEPTPDYDEEIIIRRVSNESSEEIGEEPIADYDEPETSSTLELTTSPTLDDLAVSSSFLAPRTSFSPSSEIYTQDQSSVPPTSPPLPMSILEQKTTTFRCRTIADRITADHKLILKDEVETIANLIKEKQAVSPIIHDHFKKSRPTPTVAPKPHRFNLSKELLAKTTLRKVSQPMSRSYSTYGSMSQINDHDTQLTSLCKRTPTIDEQPLDGLTSSATTSIIIENEYEHQRSSKIYNDYKRRASLISVPTSNTLTSNYSQSGIVHPMHTHIGLRSSTSSSSTNDRPSDATLSNKQMNVCVINQLNEHLTTRFRKQHQQQESGLISDQNVILESAKEHQSYDPPPKTLSTNVYDEPHHFELTKTISIKCAEMSISSIPPPPPPLPVGGFRPLVSQLNHPFNSQRTSIMTLTREITGPELGGSTGTSTTSSKLSDTRILRELRTNPLFTKAKQHLEIEPGSNGRRSGRRLTECTPYSRLETCSKGESQLATSESCVNLPKTFEIPADELKTAIGHVTKRTKSMNSTREEINSRTFTKTSLKTQSRQSELELIFQKRAQRSEQNLT